jgi:hypothetical protein
LRRRLLPPQPCPSQVETEIKQSCHIHGVERLVALGSKVVWDGHQIVVDPISLSERIELSQIAYALIFDQSRNRPVGDGYGSGFYGLELRLESAVADYV